jgi:hypothetical protein
MKWAIVIVVLVLYVHLFNAIANQYFDSGYSMTWNDVWKKFVPPAKITIELT